jgi:NhaP-type Na+/H+ or K+/H+ antiporter
MFSMPRRINVNLNRTNASGIIAAVVAGLVHGFERDRIAQTRTRLQMSYNHTWNKKQ